MSHSTPSEKDYQKVKALRIQYKTYIFREKNKIATSLHNFHLDAIKHRGQTETSAKILKTAMKADKVYPKTCSFLTHEGKDF